MSKEMILIDWEATIENLGYMGKKGYPRGIHFAYENIQKKFKKVYIKNINEWIHYHLGKKDDSFIVIKEYYDKREEVRERKEVYYFDKPITNEEFTQFSELADVFFLLQASEKYPDILETALEWYEDYCEKWAGN